MNICRFGLSNINIIAYADDIVLLAPTSGGLNELLSKTERCIIFNKRSLQVDSIFRLYNDKLEIIVDNIKYLGFW